MPFSLNDIVVAISMIKRWESFRSKPYLCSAGVATIGYGTTVYPDGRRVTLEDAPINEVEAMVLLKHMLSSKYVPAVVRLCPELLADAMITGNWSRFSAIVDWVYNLGAGNLQISTLRRKIKEHKWDECDAEIRKWNKAAGMVLRGLTLRREDEVRVWNS